MTLSRRHLLCASTLAAMGATHAQTSSLAQPAAFAAADLELAARLRDTAMADTEAWALLQQLCTDVGARPAGSAGDVKAVAWAQAAMQRLGLSAVRAEPLNLRVWQRGPASARLVAPVDEALVMAALGNSVATPPEGITAEVAWYPDLAALQADDSERPRGRIVFIDPKMERFRDGRGYGPAVGTRVNGAVLAANEVVLIGAHLDSWDLGQGAQDDGAGVAIVTAAAAQLVRMKLRPRRTVRVVLFGNEENGFDGARAYGDRYAGVPHQWVGESDFGAGKVWQMKSRVRAEALPMVASMAQLLAPLGVAWPAENANTGSPGPDAAVLMRRHKWPAVQLSQDGTHYFDVHHTVADTLDRIDPATLPQNVACWAVTAWLAAQAPLSFGPLS